MVEYFAFQLHEAVAIAISGEKGHVIARAEYAYGEDQYLIRYKNAHGAATEEWWAESALIPEPAVKL